MDLNGTADLPRATSPTSSFSTHSRPLSRASSYGSIDSGASHPPRAGRKRRKTVNIGWDEFAGQAPHKLDQAYTSHDDVKVDNCLKFACPFLRMFPFKHKDCMEFKMYRISYVKQHIRRRHYDDSPYCPTCYGRFYSKDQLDDHIRSRCCEPQDPSTVRSVEGVSEYTWERLKPRMDRKMSDVEQWYTIWDILFEAVPRPHKVYLGSVVEETFDMMRSFGGRKPLKLFRVSSRVIRESLGKKMIFSRFCRACLMRFKSASSKELKVKLMYRSHITNALLRN
ncbi:HET ankyrin domain-containing protein [Fusarium circinatum]|uniref:HET ankyrin domain-containing protein n=1 Tax=Fusarium circinatum TaxID=48490 RepID=A0A8H5X4M4_FUSCI|nr:HET ankyrin domain-containing protein [Fusarium circinatum]